MALLSLPCWMEQQRLLISALCALWSLLRVLERLSSASKLRLCVCQCWWGRSTQKQIFWHPSVLFHILHWPVSSPVLSTSLVMLFMCQRSVHLTHWWILMSVMWLLRANNAKVVGLILVWALHLRVGLDGSCGSLLAQVILCLHGFRSLCSFSYFPSIICCAWESHGVWEKTQHSPYSMDVPKYCLLKEEKWFGFMYALKLSSLIQK